MNKNEMTLLYLLMSVDGKVSKEEEIKFDTTLKQYGLESYKTEIRNDIKKIEKKVNVSKSDMKKVFETYLEQTNQSDIYAGSSELKTLLWLMVNMSFADGECCQNEKEFIKCFTDGRIESSVAEDMMDAARAMLSIQNEKDWLKTEKNMSQEDSEAITKELDKNQAVLEESIRVLIEQ